MERKLKQKSFSDVLEEAIKQRWGTKRRTPLVNFPRSTKKCKVQAIGYSTSQQDSPGTSIADHESFSQSQPIISEKKLSPCAKQTIRGWKPPLKRYQEIISRNAMNVNSITSLKFSKNNSGPKEYTDGNNLQENCSQANSVNCEDKNGAENIPLGIYTAHEVNSVLFNRMEGNEHENKYSLESTSLVQKDGAGSILQDITQISNIQQCIKSQHVAANTDSVAHENTSYCNQSSTFDKEVEMENPTSLDQASHESKKYELAIPVVNGNHSSILIKSIANSEEMLSNANTETDLENDDIVCLSQQSTQPYVLSDDTEKIVLEEEIEKPSDNCVPMPQSPKASIFENPYLTNDIHNLTINASHSISDATNEDTTKDSTLCTSESILNENVTTVKEVNLSPGKEMQDPLGSEGFKEFLDEELSSRMPSLTIFKSEMAQKQQNLLVLEQNDDKCITETSNSFNSRRNCTNRENITYEDDCISGESTVTPKSINSMEEENTNKECEKVFSGNTETIQSQPCDEINTHTDEGIDTNTEQYTASKRFVFDAKRYTKALEEKFRNVFRYENFTEETSDEVFDNNEKPSITNMNNTSKQNTQMKILESHNTSIAAVKLNEASNAHQTSEDTSFLEEMKTDKSKDNVVVSTGTSEESSELERTCKSSECALKCIDHTAKESFYREMTKTNSNAVVLSVEGTNLQMNQSTLKFNDENQNIKSQNDTKSLDTKESVILPPIERRNDLVVPDETEPLAEASRTEQNTIKYRQKLEGITTTSCQSIVNNDGKIPLEDNDKNKLTVFKDKITTQRNGNDFVFERETLSENNSEEAYIKCKRNTKLETESLKGNKFASQQANNNSEVSLAVDNKTVCEENKNVNNKNKLVSQPTIISPETSQVVVADLKFTKGSKVEVCHSSEIEKYVETKANHSKDNRLKDRPEDITYTACFNSNTKKVRLSSTDLTDQISIQDIEVKNDSKILSNSNREQYPLINETEEKTGDFILTDNKESALLNFKNQKQAENKYAALISDTTTAAKNSSTDFSEMEDDFGITVSQILRIEDECQQNMFMPEMPAIQWAQKVKESRRKIQAVVQEITMLNAMLKKARKEVWQSPSNASTGEGTSTSEDFKTLPRPISHRWNRNLNSKSGQNRQRK